MSFNLKFFRGDTLSIDIAATLAGAPLDLTGSTLYLTVKRRTTDADAAALISCQTGAGITHTNNANGTANCRVEAAGLTAMPVNIPLPCDIQVKTAAGEVFTLNSGKITFRADVTLRTN